MRNHLHPKGQFTLFLDWLLNTVLTVFELLSIILKDLNKLYMLKVCVDHGHSTGVLVQCTATTENSQDKNVPEDSQTIHHFVCPRTAH